MAVSKPAKQRRDMLQPYFSKAAIQRLEPLIKGKVSRFLALMCEAGTHGRSVNLSYAYRCLSIDVITDYCFQKPFEALESEDFKDPFAHAFFILTEFVRFEKYFPKTTAFTHKLITRLPRSIARRMSSELNTIQALQDVSLHLLYLSH